MADVEKITPYDSEGDSRAKGLQVRDMFDNIARLHEPGHDTWHRPLVAPSCS